MQNAMRCVFILVTNLGLAQLALKMHAFSACVNGVLQLSFKLVQIRDTNCSLLTRGGIIGQS